ncbi:hypothetical protein [Limimaricola hongkongensis]|uniref:Lipoprotein n=1 Tax=Limimaricola hongkongensis DSM 17492 TaxID=1122180 RepID=A0A017H8K5_9RHOB|nr:hypothetical protein [Limimaricola hongkongensis]EYD70711.1 hypothetical protein Lokhon_02352 [Limimaricola hongkongensis DSM 17492]
MRNWAIAFIALATLSGLACLGAGTPETLGSARILMVLFGALGAYAATAHALQSRGRRRPRDGGPLNV